MIARPTFADYGVRLLEGRKRRMAQAYDILKNLGLLAMLLMLVSIPLIMKYMDWRDQQALRRDWDVAGPSCAIVTALPATSRSPKAFEYGGVHFERRFGHVACTPVPKSASLNAATYPVCQFSGPAAVAVTTGDQTIVFKPGVGRAATVSVRDGKISCVVGGWFQF